MPSCSHQSEMVRRWVRAGKQVGLSFSFEHEGATWWGTVAVQIWGAKVKVYVDEIRESDMVSEAYARQELSVFDGLADAEAFVHANTRLEFDMLRPCKGHRLFNPAWDAV